MLSLALVSVHLNEKTLLPVFTVWFWEVKTFSCWFPGLMGLPIELQLCWVGADFEAVIEFVVGSMVGVLVTRGSGRYGSCLVPGWVRLPPVLCSVG